MHAQHAASAPGARARRELFLRSREYVVLPIDQQQPLCMAMKQDHGETKRGLEGADRSSDVDESVPSVTLLPVCGQGVHLEVVMYGDTACGRTCLATRYEKNKFFPEWGPTIVSKISTVERESLRIRLWDTGGIERFDSVTRMLIRGTRPKGFFLVYSIDSKISLQMARKWANILREDCPRPIAEYPILVLGNKCDQEKQREVSRDEGLSLASNLAAGFFEVSAVTGENIEESFSKLHELFMRRRFNFSPYQEACVGQSDIPLAARMLKSASAVSPHPGSGESVASSQCSPLLQQQPPMAMKQGHGGTKRGIEGADSSLELKSLHDVTLLPVCGRGVHLEVVMYGGIACGKTCLATRYEKNKFCPEWYSTIGCDFSTVERESLRVRLWDTAGVERFESLNRAFIRGDRPQGYFLVYSIDSKRSLQMARKWANILREDCPRPIAEYPILVLGNKCDQEKQREVSRDEGLSLASNLAAGFFEVSAFTGENIEESFSTLRELFVRKYQEARVGQSDEPLTRTLKGISSTLSTWTSKMKHKPKDR